MRPGLRCLILAALAASACAKAALKPVDAGEVGKQDAGRDAGGVVDAGDMDAGSADAGPADGGTDGGAACLFTFNYPDHYPCNRNADCMSGHCAFALTPPAGQQVVGVCTERCSTQGSTDECPSTFTCDYALDDQGFSTYCLPTTYQGLPPGDQSLPFGSPCAGSQDCANGAQCGVIPQGSTSYSFCSPSCDTTDPNACNGCGACEPIFAGGGTNCVPQGSGKIGDACQTRTDCQSFVCADFCTQLCMGPGSMPCPAGDLCVDDGQMQSICISPSQEHAIPDGSACLFDFQCVAGDKCLFGNSGTTVCTRLGHYGDPCTSTSLCSAGLECLPLDLNEAVCTKGCPPSCGVGSSCVAPTMDTAVSLFSGAAGSPALATSSPGTGSTWSILTYTVSPGTYWIEVTANPQFLQGNELTYVGGYTLSVTDGVNTPVNVSELPESPTNNDTRAKAQVLPQVPAIITGTLDAQTSVGQTDVDFYKFTATQQATLTFATSAGQPSECVPSGRPLGQPCTTDLNCASQQCDSTLNSCTMTCASDGDCGAGGHCVSNGQGQICVSAGQYEAVQAGGDCQFDWQCGGGASCVKYGSKQVCATLCAAASSSCDPSKTECAAVTANVQGQPAMTKACVPLGNRSGAFGATCVIQSDCQTGTQCTNGICTASCMTNADCPNQSLASMSSMQSTDVCRPCQNDADCGAGLCLQGPGYERFCGDPCDVNGKCPAGFACVQSSSGAGNGCEPVAGSCYAPTCQMNQCAIPPDTYTDGCAQDSDCTTGSCIDGLCTHACQADADCACSTGDLTCQSGACTWSKALIATQSPNDSLQTAQVLSGTPPWKISGEFQPSSGGLTDGYYSFQLSSPGTVTIAADPVCGTGAPGLSAALELLDANGNLLTDDFPFDRYPKISSYTAAAGTYVVSFLDFGGSGQPAPFTLTISVK